MAQIELKGVTKAWGDVVAVEPTNLTVDDGEFLAVLGPSGCGKSTTLFMLAGIYAPTAGDITFDGHVVNEVEAKDRNIGIVFQSYALYPHMSVLGNIMFPLKFKGQKKPQAEALAREAAALVHVEEFLDRRPSQLSGGQQQRVALARALVKEPHLLLLDEPLSNLDATLRLSMRSEIKALQKRTGITTILVTHDQVEATTMADRIVCMSRGRIEQVGTPDDLYLRPESLFVATFIGSPPINLVKGNAANGKLEVDGGAFALRGDGARTISGPTTLGIRPESVQFAKSGIDGRIHAVEPMGREVLYLVDTDIGRLNVLENRAQAPLTSEDAVYLAMTSDDTLIFDDATGRRIDNLTGKPL